MFEKNIRRRRRFERRRSVIKEELRLPPHIIKTRLPEGEMNMKNFNIFVAKDMIKTGLYKAMSLAGFRVEEDQGSVDSVLGDEANNIGKTQEFVRFNKETTEEDIAFNIRRSVHEKKTIVVRGAGSSLTKAVVPEDDTVFGMTELKKISDVKKISDPEKGGRDRFFVTVQPGATFSQLQEKLKDDGLFLPAAPTMDNATIGGGVNTDAGGARSYKYGKMRKWVQGVSLMLSSGEVLDIKRGEHFAHEGDKESSNGYFELVDKWGVSRRIPVPDYETPTNVPKVSAGIYSKHSKPGEKGMDLIDLVIGSEGTLGIITEVTVEVIKEPPTMMALVACENDDQAIKLMMQLREQEKEKRNPPYEPGGISAVEIIGENALGLVQKNGVLAEKGIKLSEGAKSLLLVQIEVPENFEIHDGIDRPEGPKNSYDLFLEKCKENKVSFDNFIPASPNQPGSDDIKKSFTDLREAVPILVNGLITANKKKLEEQKMDPAGVTKMGSDGGVDPIYSAEVIQLYKEAFNEAKLEWFFWGHGEGNFHINAVPKNAEETERAKEVLSRIGRIVIKKYKGVGTSEHGVGKNPTKLGLLSTLFGADVFEKMQGVMDAFDPYRIFSPGNLGKQGWENKEDEEDSIKFKPSGTIYQRYTQ